MKVFIGYDPREEDGFEVTKQSILEHNPNINIQGIYLDACKASGLYRRPTYKKDGKLFDVISNAPMATEFALTRFLIPWLAAPTDDWVLFMDCDMLVRCDLEKELVPLLDDKYAVMCVKHNIEHGTGIKMDGCRQTSYQRKNWSSVMAWNLKHKGNSFLTQFDVNTYRGRSLHQFCWLTNSEIGELPPAWNHLVGLMDPNPGAKIVHYTLGIPRMDGYGDCEYSAEWFETLAKTKR